MNGLSSAEWRSDTHPADRINELEARVKELETVLYLIRDGATGLWGDDLARCNAALKKEKP
jgi:hypothetical protein